jgi:hypothetical protein
LQRTPKPGLAQLRFAQGQHDAANVAIRRILEELVEPAARAGALDAYVEIVLAANDVPAARVAAGELSEIARRFNAPLLRAMSDRALGADAGSSRRQQRCQLCGNPGSHGLNSKRPTKPHGSACC